MVDIKQLELLYFQNEEDVPYELKDGTIVHIKPVLVRDWTIFENAMEVLTIEKNEINNIEVIQMSYLEFISRICETDMNMMNKLALITKYSLGEDCISIEENNGKRVLAILDDEEDENGRHRIKYIIDKKDFDNIKKIILFQNMYDYDDRYVEPELKGEIQRFYKLKNKGTVAPTLEKKKVFVISKTGMSMKALNMMTYRSFSQVYKMNIEEDIYMSRLMHKISQKYEVNEDVIHPLFEKPKDIFDEIFVDADSFTQKIQSSNS